MVMTAKERVLAVWPDARLMGYHDGAMSIYSQSASVDRFTGYLGWGQVTYNVNSVLATEQAWEDAARNLESPVLKEAKHG